MPYFNGFVGDPTKHVQIEGETLKDAMVKAGYMPLNRQNSGGRAVGQLTSGQRYSFNLMPNKSKHVHHFLIPRS